MGDEMSDTEGTEDLPFSVGTTIVTSDGNTATVRGYREIAGEPLRVMTETGEWLASECVNEVDRWITLLSRSDAQGFIAFMAGYRREAFAEARESWTGRGRRS